jgi:hypothetical protein
MRVFVACFLLCPLAISTSPGGESKKDKKGTVVNIDDLEALTPADWVKEKPSNRLRSYQFRLPKAKDDKEDAELAIFPNMTGSHKEILERWKETFQAPDGKTLDEVMKVEKLKAGKVRLLYLDIHGTYLYKDRPLATTKPVLKPGYRMLSVLFESPDGPSRIWVVGPAATVEQYKKGFDEWVKSFK